MRCFLVLTALLLPVACFAGGLSIDGVRIEASVQKDGTLYVREFYNATFTTPHHGIYRKIPLVFRDIYKRRRGIRIRDVYASYCDGSESGYHTKKRGRWLYIYVGKKGKLVTGKRCYEIDYVLDGAVIDKKGGGELLYFTAVGPNWDVPLKNITIVLDTSALRRFRVRCWLFPERGYCNGENGTYFVPVRRPGQSAVVGVAWTEPYIPHKNYPAYPPFAAAVLWGNVFVVSAWLLFLLVWWYKKGRDPDVGSTVVEYEPPKELSPVEAGLLWDFSFDGRDFGAAMVDLAVKGYLKLRELGRGLKFFGKRDFEVEVLKDISPGEDVSWEEYEIARVSVGTKAGRRVKFSDIVGKDLARELQRIGKEVEKRLKERGYIAAGLYGYRWVPVVAGIFIFALMMVTIIFGAEADIYVRLFGVELPLFMLVWLGDMAVVAFTIFFVRALARRTHRGARLKKYLEGFREFVKEVEEDRLRELYPPDKYPVVFESFFPYAMALGVGKEWAKKWERLFKSVGYSPSWYSGRSFSSISDLQSTVSSVGSGGVGGGGGGGAGGGGGGGW